MTAKKALTNKYGNLFRFSKRIIKEGPINLKGKPAGSLDKQIILLHYARSLYLADSIHRLCVEGHAIEASVLLRSLFNLFLNLKWLTSSDSEKRMTRYADFEIIFKKRGMELAKKHGRVPKDAKKRDLKKWDKEYDRIVKKTKG